MTATASADLTLQQLQDELGKHDQWLPIDGDPQLSLGRLIETNSTGPLRLGYGAWRDFLLGMQFKTASGRLITAGGRAIKNVAGYDLTKFMIGQYGIFGQILTITSRTYKRAKAALRVSFDPSISLIGSLLPTPARPHWAMISDGSLWCTYLGDEHAISFHEKNVRSLNPRDVQRQTIEQDIEFRSAHWSIRDFRASVPPMRVMDFIERAQLIHYSADPAFGIIVGPCTADDRQRLRDSAVAVGGGVVFDDPESIKESLEATGLESALLKRIKSAFDA